MKRVALVALIALVSCSAEYAIVVKMPYCPISDSARAHADSIPVLCILDTLHAKP